VLSFAIAACAFSTITLISVVRITRRTVRLNREAEDNWNLATANYQQAAANWDQAAANYRQAAADWNRVADLQRQAAADLAQAATLRKAR
jgi:multidrug resistance efflux pump